jgi:DNA repair exonuclease SbcCD nuclease subunit
MKILLFSDVHWSKTSSIVKGLGNNYTQRLEYLIKSMNWVNELCEQENCDFMICAGDMMDKSSCNDMELTALKDIQWNNKDCYFLCGNHESSVMDLRYSSLKVLESKNHYIINKPFNLKLDDSQIHFIPYVEESIRESIQNYLIDIDKSKKQIIISHNDIMGINYGGFESKIGFSIEEIEKFSDIYLIGHLHNSAYITKKILNLGSLSAHNFTNDSFNYKYGAWILDTSTLQCTFFENPYAFNFYNIEINDNVDITKLGGLKNNAVVSIKCNIDILDNVKDALSNLNNVIQYRVTTFRINKDVNEVDKVEDFSVDYLEKFKEFCMMSIDNKSVLKEELSEVLK